MRERGVRGARRAEARGRERGDGRVERLVLADGVDGLLLVGGQHQVRRVDGHEHLPPPNAKYHDFCTPFNYKITSKWHVCHTVKQFLTSIYDTL